MSAEGGRKETVELAEKRVATWSPKLARVFVNSFMNICSFFSVAETRPQAAVFGKIKIDTLA